ncbi:hypothetical protein M427DRAFT_45964 [Gonapodya prolifera JEL478]|uniref:LCCL domain-containing protein n=1 Tax=Gonapodya prolifera (strain JEL478) TaxID=1344416 RepID=A0A139A9A3_GONPJ|nr:hypothetical protein M427DRAFT_45964 [Gonapodya prolifera JEL478]|eukprot:KXS13055.1 hypothetical protein M427DRAFT_45964 [Gonapodya prolifera JEL478]
MATPPSPSHPPAATAPPLARSAFLKVLRILKLVVYPPHPSPPPRLHRPIQVILVAACTDVASRLGLGVGTSSLAGAKPRDDAAKRTGWGAWLGKLRDAVMPPLPLARGGGDGSAAGLDPDRASASSRRSGSPTHAGDESSVVRTDGVGVGSARKRRARGRRTSPDDLTPTLGTGTGSGRGLDSHAEHEEESEDGVREQEEDEDREGTASTSIRGGATQGSNAGEPLVVIDLPGAGDVPARAASTPEEPPLDLKTALLTFLALPLTRRSITLTLLSLLSLALFAVLVHTDSYATTTVPGPPQRIGCVDSFWSILPDGCGVDGSACAPFGGFSLPVRCQPLCSTVQTLEVQWHGAHPFYLEPVLLGTDVYRADSWICAAAIHAGFATDLSGGCFVVEVIGEWDNFTASARNGIKSYGFDSAFPMSYRLVPCDSASSCSDLSWVAPLLVLGLCALGALLGVPTWYFFFSAFVLGYWTVVYFDYTSPRANLDFIVQSLGTFLPAMASGYVAWQFFIKRTLPSDASKWAVDLVLFWIIPMLVGIAIILVFIGHLFYHQRRMGKVPVLILYAFCVLLVYLLLPFLFTDLYLHLHHYQLSFLLLPTTTGVQTRTAMTFQSFLIGWFLEGVGRWGFEAPVETAAKYYGVAARGTVTPFWGSFNNFSAAGNWTVQWGWTATDVNGSSRNFTSLVGLNSSDLSFAGVSAYSLVLNDVEVYRGPFSNWTAVPVVDNPINITQLYNNGMGKDRAVYFRLAGVDASGTSLDYTPPLRVLLNGTVS